MTAILIILSIALAAIVLSLFWPLIRGVPNPLIYFTNGGGQTLRLADLRIRRRVLLENLRDIQIERDFGKLNEREHADLADPLFAELDEVEAELKAGGAITEQREIRRNRLGWICPDCGHLNRTVGVAVPPLDCVQCGRPGPTPEKAAGSKAAAKVVPLLLGIALSAGALGTSGGLMAQPPAMNGGQGAGGPIQLSGAIANGSRGNSPAKVETLELIELGEGVMKTVQVLNNVGPNFKFAQVPPPTAPYLIRATYKGERYSTMVPPAPRFYSRPQALTVFDSGAPRTSVQITGAMRVTKLRAGGLAVQQFLVISNRSQPQRSFDPRGYHIYIPEGAESIRASLQHESTRVPIPLGLTPVEGPDSERRFYLDRGVRPGNSQLVIDYLLGDTLEFSDRLPRESGVKLPPAKTPLIPGAASATGHDFRIVFWQPANARPDVDGALKAEEIEIPNIGSALRVSYPPGDSQVRFNFSRGGVLIDRPLDSDSNPLFGTPTQTIVGVIAGLICLFLLASVLAGSGVRVRRSGEANRAAQD